jgi:hypothetical protein
MHSLFVQTLNGWPARETQFAKSQPKPLDNQEHMFYYTIKRHIGGEGRAHETGIPPAPDAGAERTRLFASVAVGDA